MEGMAERRRGRRPREQMALSERQQEQVVRAMVGRNPDQLELGEGKLWSRGAVRALIFKLSGVQLSRQTVGRYLHAWGWSKKKPSRRWLQQDPARVKAWLEEEYPAIHARAHARRPRARRSCGPMRWAFAPARLLAAATPRSGSERSSQ